MEVRKCCITCLTCDDYQSNIPDQLCKHCHSDIAHPSEYFEDLSTINYNNTNRLNDLKDEVAKLEYMTEKFENDWNSTWNSNAPSQWALDNHEDYEV